MLTFNTNSNTGPNIGSRLPIYFNFGNENTGWESLDTKL